jgi:NAD(P)-dependent dehydrogenase (short-subunit alcohol dehydrogenase family)
MGGTATAVRTNVMRSDDVKRLADSAFDAWGNVHVLCNNAGVSAVSGLDGVWNVAMQDWDWVLGVNFSGVLHGIRHFVPRMLEKGESGHIVNTASVAGLVTGGPGAPYTISKHAVVALSETLYKDLKACKAKLSASVLCPGWAETPRGCLGCHHPADANAVCGGARFHRIRFQAGNDRRPGIRSHQDRHVLYRARAAQYRGRNSVAAGGYPPAPQSGDRAAAIVIAMSFDSGRARAGQRSSGSKIPAA